MGKQGLGCLGTALVVLLVIPLLLLKGLAIGFVARQPLDYQIAFAAAVFIAVGAFIFYLRSKRDDA